jgi:hypothetical protein
MKHPELWGSLRSRYESARPRRTDVTKSFVFVDGGVSPYNNPAFVLFRFATDPGPHRRRGGA